MARRALPSFAIDGCAMVAVIRCSPPEGSRRAERVRRMEAGSPEVRLK